MKMTRTAMIDEMIKERYVTENERDCLNHRLKESVANLYQTMLAWVKGNRLNYYVIRCFEQYSIYEEYSHPINLFAQSKEEAIERIKKECPEYTRYECVFEEDAKYRVAVIY